MVCVWRGVYIVSLLRISTQILSLSLAPPSHFSNFLRNLFYWKHLRRNLKHQRTVHFVLLVDL